MVVMTFIAFSVDETPTRRSPPSQKSCPRLASTASGAYDVQPELAAPPVDEKSRQHQQTAGEIDPVTGRIEPRERHVGGPDVQRHQVVAETRRRQRTTVEKHHHGAVHGHQLVVELRQHEAARRVVLPDRQRQRRGERRRSATPAASESAASAESRRAERPSPSGAYCRPTALWSVDILHLNMAEGPDTCLSRRTRVRVAGHMRRCRASRPAKRRRQPPDAIRYTLRFPSPQTHYVEVEADLPDGRPAPRSRLFMAVWTPGSYLVREYERNVENVSPRAAAAGTDDREVGEEPLAGSPPAAPKRHDLAIASTAARCRSAPTGSTQASRC